MGIKLSSIIMFILGVFIAKISFENINQAQRTQANLDDAPFPQSRAAASSSSSDSPKKTSPEKIN